MHRRTKIKGQTNRMAFFKIYFAGIRTPNGTIAFSAYMTHNLSNLGNLRILVFDAIFINEGNGYNHYVGVFTAPRTGLYVFTWTIRTYDGYYNTQLLVDGLMDARGC